MPGDREFQFDLHNLSSFSARTVHRTLRLFLTALYPSQLHCPGVTEGDSRQAYGEHLDRSQGVS